MFSNFLFLIGSIFHCFLTTCPFIWQSELIITSTWSIMSITEHYWAAITAFFHCRLVMQPYTGSVYNDFNSSRIIYWHLSCFFTTCLCTFPNSFMAKAMFIGIVFNIKCYLTLSSRFVCARGSDCRRVLFVCVSDWIMNHWKRELKRLISFQLTSDLRHSKASASNGVRSALLPSFTCAHRLVIHKLTHLWFLLQRLLFHFNSSPILPFPSLFLSIQKLSFTFSF